MEKDRIAELSNEAFYQILIVFPLRQVILFERVYGQQRPEICAQAREYFQYKYGFPNLTLEQMLSLLEEEDDEEKASLYLDYGDFPKQVAELNLEEKFVEYAIEAQRDLTALALLKKYEGPDQEWWVHLLNSISWRCLECVKYLLARHDFEDLY